MPCSDPGPARPGPTAARSRRSRSPHASGARRAHEPSAGRRAPGPDDDRRRTIGSCPGIIGARNGERAGAHATAAEEFFGTPWSGEGECRRHAPGFAGCRGHAAFASARSRAGSPTSSAGARHHDLEERRDGRARLVAADRIRFTYDDRLQGTRAQPQALDARPACMGCPNPLVRCLPGYLLRSRAPGRRRRSRSS